MALQVKYDKILDEVREDDLGGLTNPLQFKGAINVNSDFPTSAEVENGWFYTIGTDVTDDDASKTNTGDSFLKYDEIAWNGTDWTLMGNNFDTSILAKVDYIFEDVSERDTFFTANPHLLIQDATIRIKDITPPSVLDVYTNAWGAYSLRKLKSGITDVVEVRRDGSSPATESFTPTEINDGTLLAWVTTDGGTEGFVSKLYDQSGNGYDVTQGTAGYQGNIVISSAIVTLNGEPAIKFVQAAATLSRAGIPATDVTTSSIYSVFGWDSVEAYEAAFRFYGSPKVWMIRRNATNATIQWYLSGLANGIINVSAQNLIDAHANPTGIDCNLNNSTDATITTATNGTGTNQITVMGALGYWQELIIYANDKASVKALIRADLNSHYGVY